MSDGPETLLLKHGGYRKLRSFQAAQLVHDATLIFCDRFIDRRSRTRDQMIQAARSGVQNIAEGSMASGTSKKTELKLTNVARASLEELLLDYEDFLRQRGFRIWPKESVEAVAVRQHYQSDKSDKSDKSDGSDRSDPYAIAQAPPEVAANTLICLIHQASYLLGRQLARLDQDFLRHGGFTERLHSARVKSRSMTPGSSHSATPLPPPSCPRCGRPMKLRIARKGSHAGQPFWGCSSYPACTGTRPAKSDRSDESDESDRSTTRAPKPFAPPPVP